LKGQVLRPSVVVAAFGLLIWASLTWLIRYGRRSAPP